MKKLLIIAAVATASLAAAQDTANSISVRGGISWPVTSDLSGSFWGAGLDYNLEKSFLNKGSSFLAIEIMTKNTNFNQYVLPITLNQRFDLNVGSEMSAQRTYAFVGLGAAVINMNPTSTVFAVRGGLGADVSPNMFAELSLIYTSRTKSSHIQGSSFGLWLGYKF